MTRWTGPGLANARVQPEVADQFAGAREAMDVADRRDQRARGDHADAGNRHNGGRPCSRRINTAWISFIARVRAHTSWLRRASLRRIARVHSPGIHTASSSPAASSLASVRASKRSNFARARLMPVSWGDPRQPQVGPVQRPGRSSHQGPRRLASRLRRARWRCATCPSRRRLRRSCRRRASALPRRG